MNAWEVNFDGLVGLTHHYAGLSFGNEASTRHRFQVSNPRQAAKQGLLKMKALADAGFPQAVIPPHERPFIPVLRQLGFSGSDEQVLEKVARQAPHWLSSVSSASPMWVANAATIAPSADTLDGKVHLTVAMMLVLPQECREHAGVWGYLNELLAADNPISELKVFDLRESMANGGGPACLRLRVVLTEEERRAVNPAVMMNDTLFNALNDWVDRYYRDRLTAADLADPQLLRGGREALDVLSQLLNLGSVYPFQREGGGNG
ncbi:TPA: hypothetical protein JEW24_000524 [Escherichia coli]|nr:hypothetical protein [Escherichia coli]